jgi:hypothetical protein
MRNHRASYLILLLMLFVACDEAVDLRTIATDLKVPAVGTAAAKAGSRFRDMHPTYAGTEVYHVVYLPTDWQPGKKFPVIVEYAGNGDYRNRFGDVSSGRVEDSKLGYGVSAGRGCIWVCMPYLNNRGTANVTQWWGSEPEFDPQPTVDYCQTAVPWICEEYGGDPQRVLFSGFSRGAIACNFIGLHCDDIARLWCGFIAFSHYDGVVEWPNLPGCDRASAVQRLARLDDRPQFICAETGSGQHGSISDE